VRPPLRLRCELDPDGRSCHPAFFVLEFRLRPSGEWAGARYCVEHRDEFQAYVRGHLWFYDVPSIRVWSVAGELLSGWR
jgi:hypothetical protein